MHLPACKHTTKKASIADFWLCRFAYGCGEGVRKQKMCARRGEHCEMCVLSAGVLIPGLAAPVCSSQGDLWPTLLKLKVHPQFRGRFTQRSTGYSATRALSLFLTPSLPPSLAFSPYFLAVSNQATVTTVCIKHWGWVVFTFIVKIPVTRLVAGAFFCLSSIFVFTEVWFWAV